MKKTISKLDIEAEGALAALKRAALRARMVAFETRTPLVLFVNGRMVFRRVTRRPRAKESGVKPPHSKYK